MQVRNNKRQTWVEEKLSLDLTAIRIAIYGTIFLALGFFRWSLGTSYRFILISLTIQNLGLSKFPQSSKAHLPTLSVGYGK